MTGTGSSCYTSDMVITQQLLEQLFSYDPNEGVLRWKAQRGPIRAGRIAGHLTRNGYRSVSITLDGIERSYLVHRIVWFRQTGQWPKNVIDHVNGDKNDNRLRNLRDVSLIENGQNTRKARAGVPVGVSKRVYNYGTRYVAQLKYQGHKYHLGEYRSMEEARGAYLKKRHELDY